MGIKQSLKAAKTLTEVTHIRNNRILRTSDPSPKTQRQWARIITKKVEELY